MRFPRLLIALVAAAGLTPLVGCSGSGGGHCDSADLKAALSGASSGEIVSIGGCTVAADSLEVPEGVTLRGNGGSTLELGPEADGVRLAPGARLQKLAIDSAARVAIRAADGGSVEVRSVQIRAERGVALVADGLEALRLSEVRLEGPVTAGNANEDRFRDPAPEQTATHGIALLGVADAQLEDVLVRGFAAHGVVAVDRDASGAERETQLRWAGGGVEETLGVGVYLSGAASSADLEGIDACGTLQGLRLEPPYGVVAMADAQLRATDVRICDNERYGLVVNGARAQIENLVATGNGDAAVWVGESDDLEITGASTELADNAFAGIVVIDSTNVRVRDATIATTSTSTRNIGADDLFGTVEVGDGLHLIGSYREILLEQLVLDENERAGLLVDLGDDADASGLDFRDVLVRGTGSQLGAIAGVTDDPDTPSELTPDASATWDEGIVREGAAAENDAAFADPLDVAGAVTPSRLPSPTDVAGAVTPSR